MFSNCGPNISGAMGSIRRHNVRQISVFGVARSSFYRIEFGTIGRQPFEFDAFQTRYRYLFGSRAMNLPTIPTDDQRPLQLLSQLSDEIHHVVSPDVGLIDLKGSSDTTTCRRERQGADDALSIVPVPRSLNRRLGARCPCPTIYRPQSKSGFVAKNNAGSTSLGFF